MAGDEWPIAAPAADREVDPARGAGRSRLATVRADFFLDPRLRLSEQERAIMSALLHGLIAQLADDLRAELPQGLSAANDGDGPDLVAELRSAGLLDIPELIAIFLHRADEERIAAAVRALSDARHHRHLQGLVAGDSPDVSAAAMALILARGRRRDRLGQPSLELDDLSPAVARRIVFAVAAALGRRLPLAQAALARAAEALVARHDQSKSVAALVSDLSAAMESAGMADDARLAAAAEEGDVAVLAEALARRAGIRTADGLDHLLDGSDGRLVLLLRMAGASRELAARILAALGDLVGIADPGREIGRFEALGEEEVDQARQRLGQPGEFREALKALGAGHGERTV